MATIEAVSKWHHEGQCPPRVSRIQNSETASPASSHTPRSTTNTKVKRHSPRQLLARAHQKNNSNTQKGKLMTYTVGQQQDAETSGENTYKKTPITLKSLQRTTTLPAFTLIKSYPIDTQKSKEKDLLYHTLFFKTK